MSKKLLISLAPFLATVAFVAMPAVAQATTPHYFSETKEIKQATKTPVLSWGTLKLTNSLKPTEPIECENESGGFAENPTGGGPGKGETQGWTAYNCKNLPECEAAGGKIAVLMENEGTPGLVTSLKWNNELIEEEGVIKLSSHNVRVFVRCQVVALAPEETLFEAGPAFIRSTTEIEAGGTVCTTNAAESGVQHPKLKNGTSAAKPPKVEFIAGAETGELACKVKNPAKPTEEIASKGATSGSLKTLGYKEQETINTHST